MSEQVKTKVPRHKHKNKFLRLTLIKNSLKESPESLVTALKIEDALELAKYITKWASFIYGSLLILNVFLQTVA